MSAHLSRVCLAWIKSPFVLTSVLSNPQGYTGRGLELRPRKTWVNYPPSTQARLFKHAIDPTELLRSYARDESSDDEEASASSSSTKASEPSSHVFPAQTFFISLHADELTPWTPIIAALTPDSAFLNVPCCLYVPATFLSSSNHQRMDLTLYIAQLVPFPTGILFMLALPCDNTPYLPALAPAINQRLISIEFSVVSLERIRPRTWKPRRLLEVAIARIWFGWQGSDGNAGGNGKENG